jgi:hypothetical protein
VFGEAAGDKRAVDQGGSSDPDPPSSSSGYQPLPPDLASPRRKSPPTSAPGCRGR